MLDAIRKRSASLLVKILLLLLIVSFGLWGVEDVFSPNPDNKWVAKVGDVEVPNQILRDEYQSELRRLRQVLGDNIDREQALALGIPARSLEQIVNRTLIDLGAADLGLVVSDDVVRQTIQMNPAFQGPQGRFEKQLFDHLVRNSGLTETGFLDGVRGDIVRGQLIRNALAGTAPPRLLADEIYRYRNEERIVRFVRIENSKMRDLAAPDEAALLSYYTENPSLFTAPEYRAATTIILNASELASGLSVADEELKAAFEDRSEEFSEPERRALEQITFSDAKVGQRAYDRIISGEDFRIVAKEEAGSEAGDVDLGTVSRDQVLPELVDVAFQLSEGSVSKLTQSPLGWHLMRVTSIFPAQQQTFEDVREQLRKELAEDKAFDALIEQSDRLEDALAGGATLEEAAVEIGTQVREIDAIDRRGLNIGGEQVLELPNGLVETVFSTGENSESAVTEANGAGAYFVVRVNKVTPASPKPFEMARNEILSAWTSSKRAEAAKERADEIANRVKQGSPFTEVAADQGFTVQTSAPIVRSGEGATESLDRSLIDSAFQANPEEIFVVRGQDASFVGMTTKVIVADPISDPRTLATLNEALISSRNNDLLSQFAEALTHRHPVEINGQALSQLY